MWYSKLHIKYTNTIPLLFKNATLFSKKLYQDLFLQQAYDHVAPATDK